MAKYQPRAIRQPQALPAISEAPRVALVQLWDWRASNSHLFASDTSLRWHLRRHRDTYVQAGALLRLTDRDFVDPPAFERVLREIGMRAAAGSAAHAEAQA